LEAEAAGLQVQGQPRLHSKFHAILGYRVRHCVRDRDREREIRHNQILKTASKDNLQHWRKLVANSVSDMI
jgi:hypothetical protein